jgi:Zn-dependent protease
MDPTTAIFFIIILFLSIVIHEYAHAYVAYSLGDPTAKYAGRLTLNPIPHIDFFGTILLPMLLILSSSPFLFGWAKPVPINPYNFKDQKYGQAKVAIAGPAANLFLALIFGLLIRFTIANEALYFLMPLIPLFGAIVIINILLALFNLLPFPPLDGSHILFTFLPDSAQNIKVFLQKYGFFLLLGFIIFGGFRFLFPLIMILFYIITGTTF